MFYILYLSCDYSFSELIAELFDFFSEEKFSESESGELTFMLDEFTLRVMSKSMFESDRNIMQFAIEDYSSNYNVAIWFDVIVSSPNWRDRMMKIVNSLMLKTVGDLVLEANGFQPVLMRKNGEVFVDKRSENQVFQFEILDSEFTEKDIDRV